MAARTLFPNCTLTNVGDFTSPVYSPQCQVLPTTVRAFLVRQTCCKRLEFDETSIKHCSVIAASPRPLLHSPGGTCPRVQQPMSAPHRCCRCYPFVPKTNAVGPTEEHPRRHRPRSNPVHADTLGRCGRTFPTKSQDYKNPHRHKRPPGSATAEQQRQITGRGFTPQAQPISRFSTESPLEATSAAVPSREVETRAHRRWSQRVPAADVREQLASFVHGKVPTERCPAANTPPSVGITPVSCNMSTARWACVSLPRIMTGAQATVVARLAKTRRRSGGSPQPMRNMPRSCRQRQSVINSMNGTRYESSSQYTFPTNGYSVRSRIFWRLWPLYPLSWGEHHREICAGPLESVHAYGRRCRKPQPSRLLGGSQVQRICSSRSLVNLIKGGRS